MKSYQTRVPIPYFCCGNIKNNVTAEKRNRITKNKQNVVNFHKSYLFFKFTLLLKRCCHFFFKWVICSGCLL